MSPQTRQIFWLCLLSAWVHAALAAATLHGVWLRDHFGLSAADLGGTYLVSYGLLALAPFGVMAIKAKTARLWRVNALLFSLFALLLFAFASLEAPFWGIALNVLLVVVASIGGSLFRASAQQALPIQQRDRHYLFLLFCAALGYGAVAFINGFWVSGRIPLAYSLFATLALCAAIACWQGPPTQPAPSAGINSWVMRKFWLDPQLLALLALTSLAVMASNAGDLYMAFLLKEELGGTDGDVSFAWAIGVLTELPLYALSALWLRKRSPQSLLYLAFAGIALRLGLLAWAPSTLWFFAAQALDGFYSGVLFAAFPLILGRAFPDRHLPFANLFAGIFYLGLGRALAGWSSGWMWEFWGLRATFAAWALALTAGFMLFLIYRITSAPAKSRSSTKMAEHNV